MLSMTHREAAIFDDTCTVPTPCLLLPAHGKLGTAGFIVPFLEDFSLPKGLLQSNVISHLKHLALAKETKVFVYSTHRRLKIYMLSVVWTSHTFGDDFGMKHKFRKYLKERCR